MAAMARIQEVTLGDLADAARRYRPVAAVAAVILVAAWILPDAPRPGAETFDPAFSPPVAAPRQGDDEPAAPEPEPTTPTTTFDNDFTFSPTPPSDDFDAGSGGSDSGTGGFVAPPSSGFSDFPTTTEQEKRPLRTTETGWASATAGTPVGTTGVPEQTLPVGNRIGQTDKASFVRLVGDETDLFMKEEPEGSRTTSGPIAVQACKITTAGWDGAPNQTFDQAPEWDPERCVDGVRRPDGVWRFSLGDFPGITDDRGFALVPAPDASIDFQVAFEQQAVDG